MKSLKEDFDLKFQFSILTTTNKKLIAMKKLFTLLFISLFTIGVSAQIAGTTWTYAEVDNAIGVGPAQYDVSWWKIGFPNDRGCFMDDSVVFESDGTFMNIFGTETWLETWQAEAEGCGAPVAPHDASNAATWELTGSALTITGVGAHLILPKAYNGGEISDPLDAPDAITYIAEFNASEDIMTVSLEINDGGFWTGVYSKHIATSVKERTIESLSVYPTVAKDYITVSAEADQYIIINAVGRVVKTSERNTIEVNDLSSGMYFVRTSNGVAKFIVQ